MSPLPKTRVIHLRQAPKDWLQRPNEFVYIGRFNPQYGSGRWGTPTFLSTNADEQEKERVFEEYRECLYAQLDSLYFRNEVMALAGKSLVGFNAPKKCYGDHLAALADWLYEEQEQVFEAARNIKQRQEMRLTLEEIEYRVRVEKEKAISVKLQEVRNEYQKITSNINTDSSDCTGMPDWMKQWRHGKWQEMIDEDRKQFPEQYALVERKLKFNYE